MNQQLTSIESEAGAHVGNRILSQASSAFLGRTGSHLSRVALQRGQVLHEAGAPVERVYFLSSGLVSLMLPASEAMQVECGMVGREGVVGAEAILGVASAPVLAIAKAVAMAPGVAHVLEVKALRDECRRDESLRERIAQSAHLQWSQATQLAMCNRLHSVEQRLARWLLTARDRLGTLPEPHSNGTAPEVNGTHHNGTSQGLAEPEIAVTQETISSLLGAHRPGVTVALGLLQNSGLIRSRRGHITVINSNGLRGLSCSCYDSIRHNFESLRQ